uniref:Nonribosomal peptide synthase n=1 Tax=Streptomyces sp. MJ635-86F5 TaxID=1321967 RepID=X5IJ97_9ACTN|nr:nonribosomal peptide synthase [Streptomyces sp. MJ635-86F5]
MSPYAAPVRDHAGNLRDYLLAAGKATPDKPAIVEPAEDGGLRFVSYRQLEAQADAYAAELDALGLDVGDRVVLESPATADAVAAFLACFSLGLPFIPTIPETPVQRLRTIIGMAAPALFLQAADGSREGLPPGLGMARFGPKGVTTEQLPAPRVRRRRQVVETDPAYLIFTSGTTGRPKGVVMSHRANIAFHRGIRAHGLIGPDDRVAVTSPFSFDFCLGGIALTLASGATAVPVPRDRLDFPRRFLAFLHEAAITQVHGVPSLWRPLIRHEPDLVAGLDPLRSILFSGEDFPLGDLRELQGLLPGRRIFNLYGATESMAASVTDVPDPLPADLERLTIGYAHHGAEMDVYDAEGAPVGEPGVVGEIYLRSPALFSGYWADPEATRAALVPDPLLPESGQVVFRTGDLAYRDADGRLYFCGRIDSQVQIRGNRVELGEVERRLREFPGVSGAVALVAPAGEGEPELSAFLTMRPGAPAPKLVPLRAFCAETLPEYMAPRSLTVLAELPVTTNGKIDKDALLRARTAR